MSVGSGRYFESLFEGSLAMDHSDGLSELGIDDDLAAGHAMDTVCFLDPRVAIEGFGDDRRGLVIEQAHAIQAALFEDLRDHVTAKPSGTIADVDVFLL